MRYAAGLKHSTLQDRISRKVKGVTRGPAAYLTQEEEEELARFLIKSADIGYTHTLSQVLALYNKLLKIRGDS